jgi:hypothetical protein
MIGCLENSDCSSYQVCHFEPNAALGNCQCPEGHSGDKCEKEEHPGVSKGLIIGLVVGAVVIFLIACGLIYFSCKHSSAYPNISSITGESTQSSHGYTRIPRRLIK